MLAALPLSAGTHTGFIRAAGQPVPGATVRATMGAERLTATSAEDGMYLINDLAPGKWVLEVEMFGFVTQRKEITVTTLPTTETWDLEVQGRAKAAAPAPAQGASGFQSLELHKLASVTADPKAPDVNQSPSAATEAFLINGSLTQALQSPQEEPLPPTPEELAVWADSLQQANWGGSPTKDDLAVFAAYGPVDPAATLTDEQKAYAQRLASQKAATAKKLAAKIKPKPSMAGLVATVPGATGPGGGKKAARAAGGPVSGGKRYSSSFGNKRKKAIFQGSAFFTLRNSAADARPYSLSGQVLDKAAYASGRFGVNAGGPLKIPKIYTKDNTFFYFSYSGTRSRSPYSAISTMPSALERSGDFSQSVVKAPITIFDPTNRQPFPNNRIPLERMNPVSLAILRMMPSPNLPGTVQNYSLNRPLGSDTDAFGTRLNQRISRHNRLAGTFNLQRRRSDSRQLYGFLDEVSGNGLNTDATWTHTFGPKAINTLKYALNRNRSETSPYFAYKENFAAKYGIIGTSQSPINYGPPNASFTNFGGMVDAAPILRRDQSSKVEESLLYVVGKHNVTVGTSYTRNQINSRTDSNARGSMSFSGLLTSGFDSGNLPLANTGFDFADFLLGMPQSSSIRFGSANTYFRETVAAVYGQDDWRLRKNLSVNLGVRWEYFSPYQEKNGRMANLDVKQYFTGVAVVTPYTVGPFTGLFKKGLVNPDKNNVSPRIGIAYKTPGKRSMLIRSGYGLYYNGSIYGNFATRLASQPPFANTGTRGTSLANPLFIQTGFAAVVNTNINNTYAVDRYYKVGYAQTWNLSIQRELPRGVVLELGYLGTKGTHLDLQRLPNRALPGSPLTAEQRRLLGNAVGFTYESAEGNSIYNAGQVRLVRRFRKGMSANLLYTYSKSIDNASTFGGGGTTVAQFDSDLALERGLSSFDQRHLLQAYYYLASPFGDAGSSYIVMPGWKGKMLRDWSLNGGVTMRSGTPFTSRVLGNRADASGSGVFGSGRAEATGLPIDGGGRFFNPTAFGLPPAGHFGNAGRNTIPGPGTMALSLSFGRSFRILESKRWIDFRMDGTNITNTVSYTSIATVVNALNYGLPTHAGSMRTLTATLRVRF